MCYICYNRLVAEWQKERTDYDELNRGQWIKVFGASSNRFLKDRTVYSFFRLFEALLMTFIYGWSLYDSAAEGVIACHYIFLTNWSLTIQVLYFWFAVWTSRQADLMDSSDKPRSDKMPFYVRAAWLFQDIAIPGSFVVFVLYWVIVVPTETSSPTAVSYFTHGVNFVVMLLDMYLSRQPYYLMHGIYMAIMGLTYLGFTYVHYAAGGTDCRGNRYIYRNIDWNQQASTGNLLSTLLFLVVPVMNVAFWFLISQCFPQNFRVNPEFSIS